MQTPFITDIVATAAVADQRAVPAGVITLRFVDQAGNPAGATVISADDLARQARAMLALAEATILFAADAEGFTAPPRSHFPLMRDIRIAEAA